MEDVEGNKGKHSCDICLLPKGVGSCRGMHPRWYYNGEECAFFFYGGCMEGGGNANNFDTLESCEDRCAACSKISKINIDNNNDESLTLEPEFFEESSTEISSFDSEEYLEATGASEQDNGEYEGNILNEDISFILNVYSQCLISPTSASLVNAEDHLVYVTSKTKNDDEEDNDQTTAMTCKAIQLGGMAGFIPEEDCSRIKTSLACPFWWPNLVGEDGEKAKIIIQKEINDMMPESWKAKIKVDIIDQNNWFSNFDWSSLSFLQSILPSSTTGSSTRNSSNSDSFYKADRIRIYVDNDSKVAQAPQIG